MCDGTRIAFARVRPLPEPFDFSLTTERFRAFGDDLANRWVDGRLVRVLGGREVAIGPADGGVEIDTPAPTTRCAGSSAAASISRRSPRPQTRSSPDS